MTDHAERLYHIVPAVYRNRDTGDLKKYFEGAGRLLDQIHQTLQQKHADNFPDNPIDGSLACQPWLLPYFADLLDVTLVSPLIRGKREEIANAVRWRQSKGTLAAVEEIAEAIGQLEVVTQEGWQRVAITPRLDRPLIPATAWGYENDAPATPPSMAARHPGLPAITPDLRCPSGAVATGSGNPAARQITVDEETYVWRQSSLSGAPCHPNHFDDVSPRTVDFRSPDWRRGHYHPDNILLYTVPPAGFFPQNLATVNWAEEPGQAFLRLIEVIIEGHTTTYRNKTLDTGDFQPVQVRGVIKLGQVPSGVNDVDPRTWRFEGLVLQNTLELDSGCVELDACAARIVKVHSIGEQAPVITASNCLIKRLSAGRGLVQLEYCTVLEECLSEVIHASDCIFTGLIKKDSSSSAPESGCLRYSAINAQQDPGGMRLARVTREKSIFFAGRFGDRSCGVLHPATPEAIRHGAADGSEMGAYHFQYLSLLPESVVEKLRNYLPIGLRAVVIPDVGLVDEPA